MAATVLLSTVFAWVFHISIDRAVSARSAELTLERGNPQAVKGKGLTLTPSLGTLPDAQPLRTRPKQPAPWWPALLFGLAFICGWAFRHTLRDKTGFLRDARDASEQQAAPAVNRTVAHDTNRDEDNTPDEVDVTQEVTRALKVKSIRLASGPDLTQDFPWDEAALDDLKGLTGNQRIAKLEKQNASKAEIIKALERLVTENREKWLHQDETEARLNSHIQELSDDLQVAVRQLQELQSDSSKSGIRRRKSTG